MSLFSISTLLMAPPAADGQQGGGAMSTIIMFAAMGLIFYFMIFRPQKKRQKEREAQLNTMEKGDKVVTSSGIHGTISAIEDGTILVQVADNTKLRFDKSAIGVVKK
jgi:preprotein translocase subunit YajC